MKFDARIGLGGIVTLVAIVAVDARALPDFYTDGDLRAWHEYGLEKFHGPWALVAMKSNGDMINYADYGSPIPAKFRPISPFGDDDDLLESLDQPPRNATKADEDRPRDIVKDLEEPENKSSRDATLELVGIIGVVEHTEADEEIATEYDRSNEMDKKELF